MKKNIVLSIFAIAFTCFGGGCVVKSESKSMGRTWIIPPGPQTKGVEHMAIEVKSLDHRGQEIVRTPLRETAGYTVRFKGSDVVEFVFEN